jgi:hypothetical protein
VLNIQYSNPKTALRIAGPQQHPRPLTRGLFVTKKMRRMATLPHPIHSTHKSSHKNLQL